MVGGFITRSHDQEEQDPPENGSDRAGDVGAEERRGDGAEERRGDGAEEGGAPDQEAWSTDPKEEEEDEEGPDTEVERGGRARRFLPNAVLLITLILSIFLTAMFGSIGPIGPGRPYWMPPGAVIDILTGRGGSWPDLYSVVVLQLRLPRILLAALVGGALGVSGAIMQALFRNPMADPYILGLSSGAGLGAGITLTIPVSVITFTVIGLSVQLTSTSILLPIMAFAGALGSIFLVYNIARVGGKVQTGTLLLSGIAVSAFLSSIVMFLLFVAGKQFRALFFWMLGGFSASTWGQVAVMMPLVLVCMGLTQLFSRDLDLLLMGEESARGLGMEVERVKGQLLVMASLLAGISVAFTGIIGFVGLIIPHMTRILVGPSHRALIPATALTGAIFMLWMDTTARTIMSPSEIPVGILTAMCGGPFFLYLLRRSRRKGGWGGG